MSNAHWFIERRKSGWMLYAWPGDLKDMGLRVIYAYRLTRVMAVNLAFLFGAKMVWANLADGQSWAYFPPSDPSSQ